MSSMITYGQKRKSATLWLSHGQNLDALESFCHNIAPYTNAEIFRIAVTHARALHTFPASSGDIQRLTLYAHLFFRRQADGKLYALKLPAPKHSQIFTTEQEVIEEVGTLFAEWYSTLAEETFLFHRGALVG